MATSQVVGDDRILPVLDLDIHMNRQLARGRCSLLQKPLDTLTGFLL